MRRLIVLLLLCLLGSGCATTRAQDAEIAKWMIPVNVVGAYFGSVGLHEGGHAITASALGASDVNVYMLPRTDRDGHRHLALTTYRSRVGELSPLDFTLINTMGPAAQFVGHVGMRELLKTRRVPRLLQPTLAWFGLFNQIGFYAHTIYGIARLEGTDLSKEDVWISLVMLGGGLAYDIYDFVTEDKPENRFKVLFGEYFYEPEPEPAKLRVISSPARGGGFFGLELRF